MKQFFIELWQYARERKKFWLLPLILLILLMGVVIFSAHTAVTSPFVYSLF